MDLFTFLVSKDASLISVCWVEFKHHGLKAWSYNKTCNFSTEYYKLMLSLPCTFVFRLNYSSGTKLQKTFQIIWYWMYCFVHFADNRFDYFHWPLDFDNLMLWGWSYRSTGKPSRSNRQHGWNRKISLQYTLHPLMPVTPQGACVMKP